jgi:methylase of polypeptide subunit release factors
LQCIKVFTGCLTAQKQVTLDPVRTSLFSAFASRLEKSIDVILFNPPYVPTDLEEREQAQLEKGISGAWAGGADGMEVTKIFLDQVAVSLEKQSSSVRPTKIVYAYPTCSSGHARTRRMRLHCGCAPK